MNDDWIEFQLGNECEKIGSGATPRGGSDVYLPAGRVSLIRSQNVYNDRFSLGGLVYLTEQHAAELENVEVQEGDILLNITGDSVARCCQVDRRVLPARVNQHVAIIRTRPNRLDARYVRYFLVSPAMQARMLSWAGSGGTRSALTKGMIESFHVPAPEDIKEQRAIAQVLGTLDDKIELNRRTNETLEGIARTIFKSWFVDFDPVRAKAEGHDPGIPKPIADLFPDEFEDSVMGKLPKGWKRLCVKDCCERIHSGGTPRRDEPRYWENANVPWLTSGEVRQPIIISTENFISEIGLEESAAKWVPASSTVVALYGATAGQVSFLATRATTNQAICSLLPKPGFDYLNYLSMRGATSDMENKAVGSAQQNISKGIVETTVVVVPSSQVLGHFNEVAGPLFARWISNLVESRKLAAIRDALLPKLLSGEIELPNGEIIMEIDA